jgi:hypothetical protein
VLLTIADIRRKQNFLVKMGSGEISIRGGQFAALKIRGNKVSKAFCDKGCIWSQRRAK